MKSTVADESLSSMNLQLWSRENQLLQLLQQNEKPTSKMVLTWSGEWSENEQKEAWHLITEYTRIFAMSNMVLEKTSLVKHSIR